MNTNHNSWTVEDANFLNHLYEIANSHHSELCSWMLAPEDRAAEQQELDTALLAIESFEACRTEFIESLEKSVAKDEDQQQNP